MEKLKIVMVGGGSYNWCPKLLSDLIQTDELNGSEVILLDPNIKAAEEIKNAMETVNRTAKRKFKFIATSNEETAFRNADFVIITISTGGLEMMRHDIEIPDKYGIYQTVGDSVGPGGWARLLRNVPVLEKMARKIEKLAPDAVILNYTNPMAGLTAAVSQTTSLRTVGLCHGLFGTYHIIKMMFNVEESDLAVRFGGINHFFWILDFKVKGQDGYGLLKKMLKNNSVDEFLDKLPPGKFGKRNFDHRVFNELFKEYGYLNYLEDRHTVEYISAYPADKKILKDFKVKRTFIKERYEWLERAREFTLKLSSGEEKIPARSRETAIDIINAFVTNKPFTDVVNLPNIGQIDNLPRGAVVETLGQVTALGFTPLAIGSVPEKLRALMEPHCRVQMMTLEAALSGNRKLAIEALQMDPLCSKLPAAETRKMGEELLKATGDYLPQFK